MQISSTTASTRVSRGTLFLLTSAYTKAPAFAFQLHHIPLFVSICAISDFHFLRHYHAHHSDTPQVVSIVFMFTISRVLSLNLLCLVICLC